MYNFTNFIHSLRFVVRKHNLGKISTARSFVHHVKTDLGKTLAKAKQQKALAAAAAASL
jgi:hypothetical protein